MDISKITKIVSSGLSGIALQSLSEQQSNFEDVDNDINTTQLLVVIAIILLIITLFAVATYKLTGSALQTMLCILFGVFYIVLAYIFYAFAGYKLTKTK
jgi:uncharacterized membrane protein (DUF106 family)